MKKGLKIFIMMIMLVAMACVSAYAGTGITEKDIQDGLDFCAEYPVRLIYNGQIIEFDKKDVPPVIVNGKTLIPARALFEAMRGTVSWNNDKQQVSVSYDSTTVVLTIGSDKAEVNGVTKTLEVPALIIDHDGDYYGSTMIPVRFTAEALGCNVSWEDPTRSVVVLPPDKNSTSDSNTNTNTGNTDSNNTSNGSTTTEEPTYSINDFNVSNKSSTGLVWNYEQLNEAAKDKLVAIDIGHGGKDVGSIGHKDQADQLYEKDVNLAAGLKLAEYLRSAGVNTLLIRDDDSYVALLERGKIANDVKADLVVSVHNNSNVSASPSGTEVHYYSKVDENGKTEMELYGLESKTLAQNIQTEMVSALGTKDRGIKSSPALAVLNKTKMPAVIIEGAFISNESDFAMMKNTESYADKYALAAAKGIIKTLNAAFK